jgi:hypothetical protein
MRSKLACLFFMVLSACTEEPSRSEPDVRIGIHFVDLPDGEGQKAELSAYWARKYDKSSMDDLLLQENPVGWAGQRFVTPDVRLTLPYPRINVTSGGQGLFGLRFFALSATLWSPSDSQTGTASQTHPGRWRQPGLLLVYSGWERDFQFEPFGPAGPTVTIPPGYSWLSRTCGAVPGQIQVEVRPISETVQFRQVSPGYEAVDIEAWELAFAASCGVTGPAIDLGTRLFFDRAQEIAWAPDDASLYYLSVTEANVRTESVALRRVRLADSLASELAVVPYGNSLQVDKTGAVYVFDNESLWTLAPNASAVLAKTPFLRTAAVSPDGRWIAHWPWDDIRTPITIWDTVAGADMATIDGTFAGWSPDARLAYWSPQGTLNSLGAISPAVPGDDPRTYPYGVGRGYITSVVWSSTGPLVASSAQANDASGRGSGLSLFNPTTGFVRQILARSAGMLETSPIGSSPISSLDVMFVWLTKCLGMFDTLCSSSLVKINLLDATVQTVAVSSNTSPVALSSNGRRIALAASNGIYVKELP